MKAWPLVLGAGSLLLFGCLANDDAGKAADTFPRPVGPKIIPLQGAYPTVSTFRFVELDAQGKTTLSMDTLKLHVEARSGGAFGYAFENPSQGVLLLFREALTLPSDSLGVYLVGTFENGADSYGDTVFWLPQKPELWSGRTWRVGDAKMEVVSADTAYYSEVIFPGEPHRHGFQRHPTALFRETRVDSLDSTETVTDYHFRKGAGLVGMERRMDGRLRASGTIREFYRAGGYPQ